MFYQKSFDSDSIRLRVQPQNREKDKVTNRWRAKRLLNFYIFRPKYRSDRLETKSKVIDLNEAYLMVSVSSS